MNSGCVSRAHKVFAFTSFELCDTVFANDCLTRRLNIRYLCDCIGIFNVGICLEDDLMTETVMTVRSLCFFSLFLCC